MRKLALLLVAIMVQNTTAAPDDQSLTQIPIGGERGSDILTIDDAARRLFLSHARKVVVVDLDADKVVGEISDTPGVYPFVPVPILPRGFSSNRKENKTSIDFATPPSPGARPSIVPNTMRLLVYGAEK